MAVQVDLPVSLPDHTQLPCEDGTFVQNFQEHPQSMLLSDAILPVLQSRYPDGHFAIGQDCGIYWRLPRADEPAYRGAVSPDWCLIPGVQPMLAGQPRRSYVMWQEWVPPLIVLEFVSGDGSEERDDTPYTGKFWIYERVIRPAFYGIYEVDPGRIEMYHYVEDHFERLPANEHGHLPITQLGVGLGIWQGRYQEPWMRWFDSEGNLLPTGFEQAERQTQRADRERERADRERQRAEEERQRAEEQRQRADEQSRRTEEQRQRAEFLAARLRELGVDPDHP